MKNYNLTHLTDSDDKVASAKSREAFNQAVNQYKPLTEEQKLMICYVAQRHYGQATPAQAMLLWITMGVKGPEKYALQPIASIAGCLADRLTPGNCTQPFTTKEFSILIRIIDGRLKNASAKMAAILAMPDQYAIQSHVREAAARYAQSGPNLVMPNGGVHGVQGWLRLSELFPPIRKEHLPVESVDNIMGMFG